MERVFSTSHMPDQASKPEQQWYYSIAAYWLPFDLLYLLSLLNQSL
jgi:hypothetical protein